jgi:ABC-type nitrate/sulfonate/bicarbonate transport system substrate-binding protein
LSSSDQALLVANSNYHVGQQIAVRVAEEQGYFREEGFSNYEYEFRGLIPGPLEPAGLAAAVKEHGLDIITAVNIDSIIYQRARGAALYLVAGWRYESNPDLKWFAVKSIRNLKDLRGCRIGVREPGDLMQFSLAKLLRAEGLDPDNDVHWIYDPLFAYRSNPAHVEMLRSGKVDAVSSAPPFSDQLEAEGYSMILDPKANRSRGRLGKVIVATQQTIDERTEELSAFLRGIVRSFWFMRDPDHFDYLRDLELKWRKMSHNDDERVVQLLSSSEKVEGWTLPIDLAVPRTDVAETIEEMLQLKQLAQTIDSEDVVRKAPAIAAYQEVSSRPELQAAFQKAQAAVKKWGF